MADSTIGKDLSRTKNKAAKPIQVNKNKKIKNIEPKEPRPKRKCTCCGKTYDKAISFPISRSPLFAANDGRIPVCRDCVEQYYKQLVDFYSGNENHAMEHVCRIFDWYYSPDVFYMTHNASEERSRVSVYPQKMSLLKKRGETYIDTVKERFGRGIMSLDELSYGIPQTPDEEGNPEAKDAEPQRPKTDEEVVRFFGYGYTDEEYDYLSRQFQEWTTRYECSMKAQEELFKNLCITQLNIRRAQARNATKEAADATKTFQDLLGSANLKPSQINDNALADQNTFGTLIKKWENERPISEPAEEWRDVDGIIKYITAFYQGHMSKALHVQNDASELYEAIMSQYTVTRPTYDDDDSAGDTSIIDKYSDKKEAPDDLP